MAVLYMKVDATATYDCCNPQIDGIEFALSAAFCESPNYGKLSRVVVPIIFTKSGITSSIKAVL